MIEYRVQGPPGTGKTFYLGRQIDAAAQKYGATFVTVCSLTRTAAANVAAAGPAIPTDNIGTIHSLAYRAVNASKIAESQVKLFNEFCEAERVPSLKLSDASAAARSRTPTIQSDDLMSVGANETQGDRDLSSMNRMRAMMRPEELWPASVRAFRHLWDRFKRDTSAHDFTDLLEIALRDVAECPGKPGAFFIDESQDFSRLAFALARKWGEQALTFVHVGDPDQILFEWAGVDPGAFFASDLPADRQRTLHQSYRVPRAVHAIAVKWIEQTPKRRKVEYAPRDADGAVRRDVSAKYRDPMPAVRDAVRQIDAGKTVMFIATCSYMLQPLIEALRAEGVPFWNPYRQTRGDWNPLARSTKKTTAVDRLLAFVKANVEFMGKDRAKLWTNEDVAKWFAWIDSKKALVRGAKSAVESWALQAPKDVVDFQDLANCFTTDEHRNELIEVSLPWYGKIVPDDRFRQLKFPARVMRKRGVDALTEDPKCVVTTVHAVKGGEADVVYLFPDLSPQAHNEWMRGGSGREGVRRTIYVGLTRARETLVLCRPSSSMSVNV
jgi:superfamily I DNA/RNA helicase